MACVDGNIDCLAIGVVGASRDRGPCRRLAVVEGPRNRGGDEEQQRPHCDDLSNSSVSNASFSACTRRQRTARNNDRRKRQQDGRRDRRQQLVEPRPAPAICRQRIGWHHASCTGQHTVASSRDSCTAVPLPLLLASRPPTLRNPCSALPGMLLS